LLQYTKIKGFILFTLLLCTSFCNAQSDSSSIHQKKMRGREAMVYSGIGVFYGSLTYGLYNAWYKNYPWGKFHFFNDNSEWMQMDKLGHAFSCYSEGVNGMDLMRYIGFPKKKSILIGGMIGFGMQTIVEVLDGHSTQWGFSWGDMGGNAFGTGMAMAQQYYWDEQRIKICYSVHSTALRPLRPNELGYNFITGLLKDYNGQTGWLSINVNSFAPESKFPAWLNLAIGYGAYGMITGDPKGNNIFDSKGVHYDYSYIKRYRIFYFAPDINLQKIPFIKKHKVLYIVAKLLAPLKVPLPTLQLDKNGLKFKAFYF
jgi:hypothetical protein